MNAHQNQPPSDSSESTGASRFMAALPDVISEIARETTRSGAASRTVKAFVRALGACTARVYLMCENGCTLHLAAAENVAASILAQRAVIAIDDEFPACAAVRLGLLQLVGTEDEVTFGGPCTAGGVVLALPLFAGTETVGAVLAGFEELTPRQCIELTSLSHSLGALLAGAGLKDEVSRLQANARMRAEQTALIVHDLRQPLTGILVGAALAGRGDVAEQRAVLERVRSCGTRLNRMIHDLCDTSLLESGDFTLIRSTTDMVALVRSAVATHLPAAEVTIDGDIPSLEVDALRIEQILANLLGNAEKYGRAGGATRVEIARRDGHVVLSVTNEGGSISEDERALVFEARYRGRDRAQSASGLGLGLYICRKLVEVHGGHIWTSGEPPQTRFTFTLPIEDASPATSGVRHAVAKCCGPTSPTWTLDAEDLQA